MPRPAPRAAIATTMSAMGTFRDQVARAGRRAVAVALAGAAGAGVAHVGAPAALAHGPVPPVAPDPVNVLLGWHFEASIVLPLLAAALAWRWAVRRVNREHPANPVPRGRTVAFAGGLVAIGFALLSGVETYDTTLFSIHMVQHILLTLVAAPLIALSGPITLLLRVASPEDRRRWILPALHSRLLRALTFPVVAWILFAGVMWASHFSPLFDLALEDPIVHTLEHGLYLTAALLFWWPAVSPDPSPWRMSHPVRALYVFLQMPQNTFLAVAILSASAPLYQHYATLVRTWGPDALSDQQAAAAIMWVAGDLIFFVAILGIVAQWMRHEDRETARADRRADAEMERIRARELQLQARAGTEESRAADRP